MRNYISNVFLNVCSGDIPPSKHFLASAAFILKSRCTPEAVNSFFVTAISNIFQLSNVGLFWYIWFNSFIRSISVVLSVKTKKIVQRANLVANENPPRLYTPVSHHPDFGLRPMRRMPHIFFWKSSTCLFCRLFWSVGLFGACRRRR